MLRRGLHISFLSAASLVAFSGEAVGCQISTPKQQIIEASSLAFIGQAITGACESEGYINFDVKKIIKGNQASRQKIFFNNCFDVDSKKNFEIYAYKERDGNYHIFTDANSCALGLYPFVQNQ